MADRYPLIANPQSKQIEELAANDNLNLTNNSIVGASTITASRFIGNLTGTATTSTFLFDGANILSGTISASRLSGFYGIGVGTANFLTNADNILSGTVPRARLAGQYDVSITGTAATATSLTNASLITGGIVPSDRLSGVYNIDITGTAYSSVGAALSLTINTQIDNTVQYLTYTKESDKDTSVFVSPDSLVYNPGLNYLGIGTNGPTAELDVRGVLKNIGLTTTTNLYATVATIPTLNGVTAIDNTTRNTIELALGLDVLNDLTVVGLSTFDELKVNNKTTLNYSQIGVSTITTANVSNLNASSLVVSGVSTSGSYSIGSTAVINSSRNLVNITGIDTNTAAAFRSDLGLNSLDGINVTGLSTFQDINVAGITSLTDVDVSGSASFQTVNAVSYIGSGAALSGIVTQITAGIGITLSPSNGIGQVIIDAYKPIGKTIFVTQSGNDSNTGLTENDSKLTIKAAAAIALSGDTIKVYPGYYAENNPIVLDRQVAVEGTELRNCQVRPLNAALDLFHVNNGCHITDLSFVGGPMTGGAAAIAFRPLVGVSSNRFFDAARLIRMNLDYIASEAVGYLTSTDYKSPAFVVPTGDSRDCSDDIKDIFRAICHDITRGGNSKCVGTGKSYYTDAGALQHITGVDSNGYSVKDATIDVIKYAVGVAFSCINNVSWEGGYQSHFTQVKDVGIIADPATGSNTDIGSCANVLSAVDTCAGIVTTIINQGTSILGAGINTSYPGNAGAGTTMPNHPSFSPGVGPILQGPYIRNCTNFIPGSIGMKVDGFAAEPGDKDDVGVTGSMSVDSYTQFNQGGIGVSISNGAYAQLVSIFTICCDTAIVTESGGQCDLTNSNSSFGNYGLISRGVGNNNTKSIYTMTGLAHSEGAFGENVVTISGVGTYRPYDGQVMYFGDLYYSVQEIEVLDQGNNYTTVPRITISSPTGDNGITAQATPVIEDGRITAITVVTAGSQYKSAPTITIDGPVGGGVTATAVVSNLAPIYYRVVEATLPSAGITTITLAQNLNNIVSVGQTAYFSRLSQQLASSHSFEYIGSGIEILQAKPALGGVTIQENEVVKVDGGEVIYTSTDQAGNFRIGDGITINQATGSLSGRDFTKALFTTMTPFILALAD